MDDPRKPGGQAEQDRSRAAGNSGRPPDGGSAGSPEELDHIGRAGKGMGGTSDAVPAPADPKDDAEEGDDDAMPPTPPKDADLPVNSGP